MYVVNQTNNTVTKFAAGHTTVSATYTSDLNDPNYLAFDHNGNLYVTNFLPSGSGPHSLITEFTAGTTTASATYSPGLSDPAALAFDSNGDLYAASDGNDTVSKFTPGNTAANVAHVRRR